MSMSQIPFEIESLRLQALEKPPSQLTPLERSTLSDMALAYSKEPTARLCTFFREVSRLVGQWVQKHAPRAGDEVSFRCEATIVYLLYQSELSALERIVFFVPDLFEHTSSPGFNKLRFFTYLRLQGQVLDQVTVTQRLQDLSRLFKDSLNKLHPGRELRSGAFMEILWASFASTQPGVVDIEKMRSLRELTDKFDQLVWSSEDSVARLVEIRNSIVDVSTTLISGCDGRQRVLEVSHTIHKYVSC